MTRFRGSRNNGDLIVRLFLIIDAGMQAIVEFISTSIWQRIAVSVNRLDNRSCAGRKNRRASFEEELPRSLPPELTLQVEVWKASRWTRESAPNGEDKARRSSKATCLSRLLPVRVISTTTNAESRISLFLLFPFFFFRLPANRSCTARIHAFDWCLKFDKDAEILSSR